jgi:hypothetical protein
MWPDRALGIHSQGAGTSGPKAGGTASCAASNPLGGDHVPGDGGYDVVPRVIRTEFVTRWGSDEDAREHAGSLRGEIMASIQEERPHELTPFTGQSAGLIHDVLPAAEIVRGMVSEAEEALAGTAGLTAG